MALLSRTWTALYPPTVPKSSSPIRFGILGAAAIAPMALLLPARSCADAEIVTVGARDLGRAQKFSKKWGIKRAVQGYDAVLQDPEVDAIYNPLPNGLHYEWTIKALLAGKHVLLEKPATDTAAECEHIFALAKAKNLVVLEAFHYQFHPAAQRLRSILTSGELGPVKHITARMAAPGGFIPPTDIRYNLSLGGGATMDVGCYVTSISRFLMGSEPVAVERAEAVLQSAENKGVDRRMEWVFSFPPSPGAEGEGPKAECMGDLGLPGWGPFGWIPAMPQVTVTVKCEKGEATLMNFVAPSIYHYITVHSPQGRRTEKAYTWSAWGEDAKQKAWKGEAWWTTYRFQLEAFVDRLKGREAQHWVTGEESVGNMRGVEMVYEKSGLGVRPASGYKIPE